MGRHAGTSTPRVAAQPPPVPAQVPPVDFYPPAPPAAGALPPAALPPAPLPTAPLPPGPASTSPSLPNRRHAPGTARAGESGVSVRAALAATVVALALSGLFQYASPLVVHRNEVVDESLRRALVVTVGFYLLIGAALLTFVLRARVRLVWHRTGVASALLLGLPLGIGGGLLGVGVNSANAGHLASDPNVTSLVGGGGAARLFLTFVTVSVLAPLTEETIFRGICAGSLLARGTAPAAWTSAVAFAIWHYNAVALRYYAVMGLVFAAIWLKRGLLASMTAHAAFNGVLAVAAVAATTGTSATTSFGAIRVEVPGGWHVEAAETTPGRMYVDGPAGAGLALMLKPQAADDTVATLGARLATVPVGAGVAVDPGSVTTATTPLGPAVVASFTIANQPGHVLELPYDGSVYEVVMVTAGSPAAERAWAALPVTLRAG